MGKGPAAQREDRVQVPSAEMKTEASMACGAGRFPRAYGPHSPAMTASSTFSERPYLRRWESARCQCSHTLTHTHTHTRTHTCTHTHMYTYTHIRMHTYTPTHARTHAHPHTCTHTHTHMLTK